MRESDELLDRELEAKNRQDARTAAVVAAVSFAAVIGSGVLVVLGGIPA